MNENNYPVQCSVKFFRDDPVRVANFRIVNGVRYWTEDPPAGAHKLIAALHENNSAEYYRLRREKMIKNSKRGV